MALLICSLFIPAWCGGVAMDGSDSVVQTAATGAVTSYSVGSCLVTVSVTYYGGANISRVDSGMVYPRRQDWASLGGEALGVWMNCATDNGGSNYVLIDITLSEAVAGVSFTLADIDTGGSTQGNSGRYAGWQDIVVVSAFQGTTQQQVTGVAADATPSFAIDTDGSAYSDSTLDLCAYGTDGNVAANDASGDLTVTIADAVDHIQIRYMPGGTETASDQSPSMGTNELSWTQAGEASTARPQNPGRDSIPGAGPSNPDGQRVLLGDLYFQAPEPGAGLLLAACGLALLAGRPRGRQSRRPDRA